MVRKLAERRVFLMRAEVLSAMVSVGCSCSRNESSIIPLRLTTNISELADMSRDLPVLLTRDRPLTLQAKLFRGLSDYSRLSILQALRAGPLTVGEIVAATGLSQPNASNHLRCLS